MSTRYVASNSEVGQSGATSRAIRMMCSMTIASRPLTTPAARVRTAPQVPALIVPNATSMSRSVNSTVEGAPHLLDFDAEPLRDEVNRRLPGQFDEARRLQHRLEVEWAAESHPVHHHVGDRVVIVERDSGGGDGADVLRLRRHQQSELVGGEAGEDARDVEGRVARFGRRLQLREPIRRVVRRRVHQAGRGRRHDVDPRLQQPHVIRHRAGVTFGPARGIHHAVGREGDERIGIVGGREPNGVPAGELADVLAVLLGRMNPYANQFEVGTTPNRVDRDGADSSGRPYDGPERFDGRCDGTTSSLPMTTRSSPDHNLILVLLEQIGSNRPARASESRDIGAPPLASPRFLTA